MRDRAVRWVVLWVALALPVVAGATEWGWLGVRIRDLSEPEMEEISSRHGIREGYGVLIVEVLSETPAARSGLRNGDVVVAFRDRPVVDTRALQRLVGATPAGQEITLVVLRQAGRQPVAVTVGLMPPDVVAERVAAEFGFVVREPSEGQEGAPIRLSGLPAVAVVLRGSRADRAGLKSGDVIVEVNGRSVFSRQAVSDALLGVTLDQPLRLTVRREEERIVLTLAPVSPRIP